MNNTDYSAILNDSLQRCLANERFISIFYELFLDTSDEIREKFKNSDFERQINMMQKSLNTIISVSESNWESDKFLSEMAKKHKQLDIKPEHYELWENSLLATVAQCDQQYNEEICEAWKHILHRGIEFMQLY